MCFCTNRVANRKVGLINKFLHREWQVIREEGVFEREDLIERLW